MSHDVLEDVYFRLGETTKGGSGENGSASIGGFGRARLLTCFAQEAYTIRTQNVAAFGSGAEYHIDTTDAWHVGCEFVIDVHLPTMNANPRPAVYESTWAFFAPLNLIIPCYQPFSRAKDCCLKKSSFIATVFQPPSAIATLHPECARRTATQ